LPSADYPSEEGLVKFQAKYDNASYVIEPKDTVYLPGGKVNRIRGIRAEFRGRFHIFDSEVAAKAYRWDAKTKKHVEEYLMEHQDFGTEIYLLDIDQAPEWAKKKLADVTPDVRDPRYICARIVSTEDDFVQCRNYAVMGNQFCEEHMPSNIVQGILTTNS
jgi:hypothetical protein